MLRAGERTRGLISEYSLLVNYVILEVGLQAFQDICVIQTRPLSARIFGDQGVFGAGQFEFILKLRTGGQETAILLA